MDAVSGFSTQLEGARAGDERALRTLYRELHPRLRRYLAAHETARADEIASEVWVDVAAGLDRFDGDERAFRAWCFAIARRRLAESGNGEEPVFSAGDEVGLALRRIAALSHQDAEVILLRVVGGFTPEEVGIVLRRPTSAVRSIQERAIKRLARSAKEAA